MKTPWKIQDPNNKYYKYALAKEMSLNTSGSRILEFYPPYLEWHPEIIKYRNRRIIGESSTNPLEYYKVIKEKTGPARNAFTVGTGSGWHQKEIMRLGLVEKWVSLDLTLAKGDDVSTTKGSSFVSGDLNFIELPENEYDLIFCVGVLHHCINLEHILFELNKSLTDDGVIIILEATTANKWQWKEERVASLEREFRQHFGDKYRDVFFKKVPLWIMNNRKTPFASIRGEELREVVHHYFEDSVIFEIHWNKYIYPFLNTLNATKYFGDMKASDDFVEFVLNLEDTDPVEVDLSPTELFGIYRKGRATEPLSTTPWESEEIRTLMGPAREPWKIALSSKLGKVRNYMMRNSVNTGGQGV